MKIEPLYLIAGIIILIGFISLIIALSNSYPEIFIQHKYNSSEKYIFKSHQEITKFFEEHSIDNYHIYINKEKI